ncbi:MAG TPA: DUF58 domain-containing protein [Accumulibacter sp.]|nr:DUF58 domain-containing protein [Accumulibacter sp.]HMW17366.1 DUF58 domain-containing protein [Accumulibacter sp.]HMX23477.1 DUF58 domain-containing protein [Accumulibacter sp.]HMY07065.1 DUF58 domain-containing protein [Accumulibacter sp.]HNC17129.1 DUF58 domain-containing protein [Accumulibacter sp.]
MLIPGRRLVWTAVLWLMLAIAVAFLPALLDWWQALGITLLGLSVADALAGRRRRGRLAVQRELAHIMPVGTWQTVALRLSSVDGRTFDGASGWLADGHPPSFRSEGLPLRFKVEPGRWQRVAYRVSVVERGRQVFDQVTLRCFSPLRLWLVQETIAARDEVRVFPNFARVAHYTLLATDNRLSQIGILQRRRRGEGMEFLQLRDYRQDDSPRLIDWKASSRVSRLIAREHQDERDQQIIFLLDCSARMRYRDGDLSHFDHTLNALLLLAYVALRQGDAVGLATFGHPQPRVLLPGKSLTTVQALMNAVFDLEPSLQVPDYLVASENLARRQRKRALVVLVTNLRDEDHETLLPAVKSLRRRHAVTVASLREPVLDEIVDSPVRDFDEALTRAAAVDYLQSRRRQLAWLRHDGVQILDVAPRDLPVTLINHYWSRKRAGAL